MCPLNQAALCPKGFDDVQERPRQRLELSDDPRYNHFRSEVIHFLHERHARKIA